MNIEDLTTKLRESIQEGEWSWLAPHEARGAIVLVSPELDLADAGAHVSQDVVEKVSSWLSQGLLAKPTPEQVEAWNEAPSQHFHFLIVQPYVLIQAMGH